MDTLAKYRTALTDALAEIKVTRKDLKTTFQNRLSGQIIRGGVSSVKFLEFYSEIILRDKADGKRNWKTYNCSTSRIGMGNLLPFPQRSTFHRTFRVLLKAFYLIMILV